MNKLDPEKLFERIAGDIPQHLHQHLFVTGSLAAAYHYKTLLQGQAINTKDADLVVHPAGNVKSCREIAQQLLRAGWRHTGDRAPRSTPDPVDKLPAIRLFPPGSKAYFVEFLNIPERGQTKPKRWIEIELEDGWYGVPSFRFLGIASIGRIGSRVGLEYASPPMMALTNLLSHPQVGKQRIESGSMKGALRSAKDLGRVIALAYLAGREETESWHDLWLKATEACFPEQWKDLLIQLGSGLEELLQDQNALEDARMTTDIGILNGMNVSTEGMQGIGDRLMQDVIEPLRLVAQED